MNGQIKYTNYTNEFGEDLLTEERIDGKIYFMARPADKHIDVQYNIANIFNNYFRLKKKKCMARIDGKIDLDDSDNYVVPDVMVFCHKNSGEIPLIVVEILSKSTWKKDLGIKMEKYAKLGIKEYWIVDCNKYVIDIYLLNDNKIYEKYDTYVYYTDRDFSKSPKLREEEKARIEIITEFSPASITEMKILLEDVFYFIDELTDEDGEE